MPMWCAKILTIATWTATWASFNYLKKKMNIRKMAHAYWIESIVLNAHNFKTLKFHPQLFYCWGYQTFRYSDYSIHGSSRRFLQCPWKKDILTKNNRLVIILGLWCVLVSNLASMRHCTLDLSFFFGGGVGCVCVC